MKLKSTHSFLENKINNLENENSAKSLVLQTITEGFEDYTKRIIEIIWELKFFSIDLFGVKTNVLHLNQELVGSTQIGSQREKYFINIFLNQWRICID